MRKAERVGARVDQLEIWSKVRSVLDYDADPARPGRPLMVLLGGASLALLALSFIVMAIYRTWVLEENSPQSAYPTLSLLFLAHMAGVYLFAYGYELYDRAKALRLTLVISVVSFGAITAVLAAIMLMMRAKDGTTDIASLLEPDEPLRLAGDAAVLYPFTAPVTPSLGRFDTAPGPAQPYAIKCIGCRHSFEPAPPRAICPICGRENVRAG